METGSELRGPEEKYTSLRGALSARKEEKNMCGRNANKERECKRKGRRGTRGADDTTRQVSKTVRGGGDSVITGARERHPPVPSGDVRDGEEDLVDEEECQGRGGGGMSGERRRVVSTVEEDCLGVRGLSVEKRWRED